MIGHGTDADYAMPAALIEAHRVEFDYRDGAGVDFEPYPDFLIAVKTAAVVAVMDWEPRPRWSRVPAVRPRRHWWRGCVLACPWWRAACAGTGGFLGSEGEAAVLARNMDGYLWLLAAGFGLLEAMMYPRHEHDPRADIRLVQIAERWAPSARQSAAEVISAAREEFPHFEATMDSLCR